MISSSRRSASCSEICNCLKPDECFAALIFFASSSFDARTGLVAIPIENPDSLREIPFVYVLSYFLELVHAQTRHHLRLTDWILFPLEARLKGRGAILLRRRRPQKPPAGR